jgi:tRNA pseudouridine13 synthase
MEMLRVMGQVRVGDCAEADAHLHSGELSGNRFVLAIRNVTAHPSAVGTALAALRDRGFLNYFGMQRCVTPKQRASSS